MRRPVVFPVESGACPEAMEKKPDVVQISSAWSSRDGSLLGRTRYVELELRGVLTTDAECFPKSKRRGRFSSPS